jgi:hypothetical protein
MAMYEQDGAPLPDEDTLLLQVNELLGHASVATSRKYIRRERKRKLDRKRAEHKQFSDRSEHLKQLNREIAIRQDQLRRLETQANAETARKSKR